MEKIDHDIARVVELLEPETDEQRQNVMQTLQARRNALEERRDGIPGTLPRKLRKNVTFVSKSGDDFGGGGGEPTENVAEAQIVTSDLGNSIHAPVLDLDFEARCVPSTQEGHWHLYLDKPMTWDQYKVLLRALSQAGVIEKGFANASIMRSFSAVRVPWLKKKGV